jgi:hypothetical protein
MKTGEGTVLIFQSNVKMQKVMEELSLSGMA